VALWLLPETAEIQKNNGCNQYGWYRGSFSLRSSSTLWLHHPNAAVYSVNLHDSYGIKLVSELSCLCGVPVAYSQVSVYLWKHVRVCLRLHQLNVSRSCLEDRHQPDSKVSFYGPPSLTTYSLRCATRAKHVQADFKDVSFRTASVTKHHLAPMWRFCDFGEEHDDQPGYGSLMVNSGQSWPRFYAYWDHPHDLHITLWGHCGSPPMVKADRSCTTSCLLIIM